MAWNIEIGDEFVKGTLNEVVERAISYLPDDYTPCDVDRAVERAVSEECCDYATMLAVIHHMGYTSEAFTLAEEEFSQVVWETVAEEVGDERMGD